MTELLASKVVIEEEEPRVRGIPAAPTAVTGAVGVTQRGPIGVPTLCTSFDEFLSKFGTFTLNAELILSVMSYFENGGRRLYVVRTVHYTDPADPSTATALRGSGYLVTPGAPSAAAVESSSAEPFYCEHGQTLVISVGGGPDQTMTIQAVAAVVAAGGPGPYALENGMTLLVEVDDDGHDLSVAFATGDFVDIGAATAAEVAAVIARELAGASAYVEGGVPKLRSDRKGTGSHIQVKGGTANAVLGFSTGKVDGTGNVADVKAVTCEEFLAIAAAVPITGGAFSQTAAHKLRFATTATGAAASVQVKASSTLDDVLGFDNEVHNGVASPSANSVLVEGKDEGAYANLLDIEVGNATSGAADEFNLAVVQDGVYRERFPNLSMDPDAERYIETVVNNARTGSSLVRVTDQLLDGNPRPTNQTADLAGGDDGLAGLVDNDFIGAVGATGSTGLQALRAVQDVTLLMNAGRATAAYQDAVITFCEETRKGEVFAVLDPPKGSSATAVITYVETTAALLNSSEFGAIYWPWPKVLNPSRSVFGSSEQIVVPPSGAVCGVYSRTDGARPGGVYDPPAGIERGVLRGVLGFEDDSVLREEVRDLVYPKRINPLTTGPGLPRFIDGSRTLKASGNFPFVAERRGVIYIERSVRAGLQFARHSNNTESLRAAVRRAVVRFLLEQMNVGAFRSREPEKAFFVDVSDELNPPTEVFAGRLNLRIGLATNKPAEFVIIRVSQDTRALEEELAAAGA